MKQFFFLLIAISIAVNIHGQPLGDIYSLYQTGFIENIGQVKDQNGRFNDNVAFIYTAGSFNLQLNKRGFSYELFEAVPFNGQMDEAGLSPQNLLPDDLLPPQFSLRSYRIDVHFENANSYIQIIASDPVESSFNYYLNCLPQPGILNAQSFNTITYQNVYNGIDLVFFSCGEKSRPYLKYEWIIHPKATPKDILLSYAGASSLMLNPNGDLQITNSGGIIQESSPRSYVAENSTSVPSVYQLIGNFLSYKIASDEHQTIIIDPNIIWSTYFGGTLDEEAGDIQVDPITNKVVVSGWTGSTSSIASAGAYQTVYGGDSYDGFVAKFKSNGKLEWATYLGGPGRDYPYAASIDQQSNIVIGGLTYSNSGIATAGAHQTTYANQGDCFLSMFTSTGAIVWSTYMGGGKADQFLGVICIEPSNILCVGYTESAFQIATNGAYEEDYQGDGDCMITKFNSQGQILWSTYFSGTGQDRAHHIIQDNWGDLYVNGTCESDTLFSIGAVSQTTIGGGEDAFIAKFDSLGFPLWCSYYGGAYEEHGRGVEVDSQGNSYICGWTTSEDNIAVGNSFQTTWSEGYFIAGQTIKRTYDAFAAKFDSTGNIVWGTYYGGADNDQFLGMALNSNGYVYLVGTFGSDSVGSSSAFQQYLTLGSSKDGFIASFDFNGNLIFGSYLGADGGDRITEADCGTDGMLYLGFATDSFYYATPNTYSGTFSGEQDNLIIKFYPGNDCLDLYEPNNSFNLAKQLKTQTDTLLYGYNACISAGNDKDWFWCKVSPSKPNLKVILSDLTREYDLELYNNLNQLIFSSANTGLNPETIIYNNAPQGNYRIRIVHSHSEFDPLNCYQLKVLVSNVAWVPKILENGAITVSNSSLLLFPNPSHDILNLKVTITEAGVASIRVIDMLNRTVIIQLATVTEGIQTIPVLIGELPAGPYLLQWSDGKQVITRSFIVQ